LHRRAEKDIWEGLFELPLIETEHPMDFAELKETPAFKELFGETGDAVWSVEDSGVRHVLSHQILHATFYKVEIRAEPYTLLYMYEKTPITAVGDYPVPKLIYNYLSKMR
jgi:A/G-specific adenine glycosylase